jgi:hypothetical protein
MADVMIGVVILLVVGAAVYWVLRRDSRVRAAAQSSRTGEASPSPRPAQGAKRVVIVDEHMAQYLQSTAPDPTQASLDGLLASVTRVRVIAGGVVRGKAMGTEVLLETAGAADVADFRACLKIVEDPRTFGHCMCFGNPALELYAGEDLAATIGFHHGRSIRWEAWKHDALLQDGNELVNWLAERGVTGPRQEVEYLKRQQEQNIQAARQWATGMPAALEPFWNAMMQVGFGQVVAISMNASKARRDPARQVHANQLPPMRAALEKAYPDPVSRALVLLGWYGHGQGPWSGFPAYETFADELLLEFPAGVIVAALDAEEVTPAHLEGAARHFARWGFLAPDEQDTGQVPEAVKQRLLEHVRASGDEKKCEWLGIACGVLPAGD